MSDKIEKAFAFFGLYHDGVGAREEEILSAIAETVRAFPVKRRQSVRKSAAKRKATERFIACSSLFSFQKFKKTCFFRRNHFNPPKIKKQATIHANLSTEKCIKTVAFFLWKH